MNIGNEIKRLRKLKGLSQNELAEVLHVTAQSIENGNPLSNDVLLK